MAEKPSHVSRVSLSYPVEIGLKEENPTQTSEPETKRKLSGSGQTGNLRKMSKSLLNVLMLCFLNLVARAPLASARPEEDE